LLCATKDSEVVEYALSRTVSPALVAEYQTRLPDKKLLQAKLHEFYELAQDQMAQTAIEDKKLLKPRKSHCHLRPAPSNSTHIPPAFCDSAVKSAVFTATFLPSFGSNLDSEVAS
jgi:hypothetical protein